MQADLN